MKVIIDSVMRKVSDSIQARGVEDYLKEICKIYRGEEDNPHDVNALLDEERAIQFLRYHLWDVERSVLESPGYWRYLIIENYGSIPLDEESVAQKIYDYAVKTKLDRLCEMGINLNDVYRRLRW